MDAIRSNGEPNEIASAIHLEFIKNLAVSGEDKEKCAEAVEVYHRAIFLSHSGRELERLDQERRVHEDRLAHLEIRLKESRGRLSAMPKLLPVEVDGVKDIEPAAPWNNWDRAMFGVALCGIVCLLVFGVLNVSFNLLESGLVTFLEQPIRAYFWAALLPVAALAVKIGWDFLARGRNLYLWTCLAAGILGVLAWLAAYAAVFPSLSKSTGEHLQSLSVFERNDPAEGPVKGLTSGRAKRVDMIMFTGQAVAEIFLSAALGIYMTLLYLKHRRARLAQNPGFAQWEQERHSLEERVQQERSALAVANGGDIRLRNQLAVFVAYAKSLFQREFAARQDSGQQKYRLLSDIQEELRAQLAAVEPVESPRSLRPPPLKSEASR